jgi:hypothetical protein
MKKMLFNLLLALPVLVLVACGGPSATTESPPAEVPQEAAEPAQEQEAAPAATSPLEPTLAPRSATLQSAEGTIQIRTNAGGGILAVEPGMALVAGNEIQTGPDGEAVLLLDDGTVIVVAENSTFTLTSLDGTPDIPITQSFLRNGQVFSIRDAPLPQGAAYQVETPAGVATIRGSAMGVSFSPEFGSAVTCLTGLCGAQAGGQDSPLAGGQAIDMTDAGLSEVTDMASEQIQEWSDTYDTVEESGVEVEDNPLDSNCSCEDTTLVCEDGTSEENSPDCDDGAPGAPDETDAPATDEPSDTGEVGCNCSGTAYVCDADGETFEFPDHPACGGAGTTCWCIETVQVCPDSTVSFDHPACGGTGSGLPSDFNPLDYLPENFNPDDFTPPS